jgi:hypothetical protein
MGGTLDSAGELGDWRGAEFFVCARVGAAGAKEFARQVRGGSDHDGLECRLCHGARVTTSEDRLSTKYWGKLWRVNERRSRE